MRDMMYEKEIKKKKRREEDQERLQEQEMQG